jgi:hypothetical protein
VTVHDDCTRSGKLGVPQDDTFILSSQSTSRIVPSFMTDSVAVSVRTDRLPAGTHGRPRQSSSACHDWALGVTLRR